MMRRLARYLTTTLLGWHESWWDETDTLPKMGRALERPLPMIGRDKP